MIVLQILWNRISYSVAKINCEQFFVSIKHKQTKKATQKTEAQSSLILC